MKFREIYENGTTSTSKTTEKALPDLVTVIQTILNFSIHLDPYLFLVELKNILTRERITWIAEQTLKKFPAWDGFYGEL